MKVIYNGNEYMSWIAISLCYSSIHLVFWIYYDECG